MAVTEDRKYTKEYVYKLLESIKGKTLGEVDKSHEFARTEKSSKITGIAGMVIEQSVFGYAKDSDQECDIEIEGMLTELKTTGVRIPKSDLNKVKDKHGAIYNQYLGAKEGISITGVTFEPTIQLDFQTSHFWEKSQRLLIVFYEYKSYEVVPAAEYASFPIVDYCYNSFSQEEQEKLRNDWEVVRDYLNDIYHRYPDAAQRNEQLVGFTHRLRPNLLLIELVPGFKKRASGSYQKPRYRLKQSFVDYIVRGHFNKHRDEYEIKLKESFSSFKQLEMRCHTLSQKYASKTLTELKQQLNIDADIKTKDFTALCVLKMFDANCTKLNQIADFNKAGIIAKTITTNAQGGRTEDMKLKRINFEEWADRDVDFEDSEIYTYFCEYSLLCPIFCEHDCNDHTQTTFEGFKRFSFEESFIENEVKRTWEDSRKLIHRNELVWEYKYDKQGNKCLNKSGSYIGAPNFPKSSEYIVFFRGGSTDSSEKYKTEVVNGIHMLPQFFWLKGSYIVNKLKEISFL